MYKPPGVIHVVRPVTGAHLFPEVSPPAYKIDGEYWECWELQRICKSLKAKWNRNSLFSRRFPAWKMMGLPAPCAFPGAALTDLGFFTAEPAVLSPLDMNELLISLLWHVHNYIFWNKAKQNKQKKTQPRPTSTPIITFLYLKFAPNPVLPKFPTSAASNNNKTWKGLSSVKL